MSSLTAGFLDSIDWQILSLLQNEGRISFKELGQCVNLSGMAVAERVRKLEENGIIKNYSVRLNLEKLGLPIAAYVSISPFDKTSAQILAIIETTPEIVECKKSSGSGCILLKVVAASLKHLDDVLNLFVGLGKLNTSIVLSNFTEDKTIDESIISRIS